MDMQAGRGHFRRSFQSKIQEDWTDCCSEEDTRPQREGWLSDHSLKRNQTSQGSKSPKCLEIGRNGSGKAERCHKEIEHVYGHSVYGS